MKHVFVETNFIVDVARPLPTPGATRLLCNLNKKDFDAAPRSALRAEYDACALRFLASFAVLE